MTDKRFIPLPDYVQRDPEEIENRSAEFYQLLKRRHTVREFSGQTVPRSVIENCIRSAGTAPSGANMQPWHFVAVSDPETKKKIRTAAEEVEKDFYDRRAPEYWLEALAHLDTDANKPHLEEASHLIVIFAKSHTVEDDGAAKHNYYISESVGISMGMLITALHYSGLVCLTHTPQPMKFLRELLGRPKHETPVLILAVGYPKEDATVPDIGKKALEDISTFVE